MIYFIFLFLFVHIWTISLLLKLKKKVYRNEWRSYSNVDKINKYRTKDDKLGLNKS